MAVRMGLGSGETGGTDQRLFCHTPQERGIFSWGSRGRSPSSALQGSRGAWPRKVGWLVQSPHPLPRLIACLRGRARSSPPHQPANRQVDVPMIHDGGIDCLT